MVEWGILISLIAGLAITVVGAIYFVVYYSSPLDKNQAWLPKILTIIGFCFFVFCCLLLPLDVANVVSDWLPVSLIWEIMMYIVLIYAFIIAPFFLFYYESAHESITKAIFAGIGQMLVLVVAVLALCLALYFIAGTATIPYVSFTDELHTAPEATCTTCTSFTSVMKVSISFMMYTCIVVTTLGAIFFYIFTGVGMFALPIDAINTFRHRPAPMSAAEYAAWRIRLRDRAVKLRQYGQFLQRRLSLRGVSTVAEPDPYKAGAAAASGRKAQTATEDPGLQGRHEKTLYRQLEIGTKQLEADLENVEKSHGKREYNPLVMYGKLVGAVFGIILGLLWIVHICLYMIPPLFGLAPIFDLMGATFVALDNAWGFLSLIVFGLLTLYLTMSLLKGLQKFSFRFIFLIPIHPLIPNDTLASSFLFNVGVLLMASLALVYHLTSALGDYAAGTSASTMWTTLASNTDYLSYVLTYGTLALAGIALISAIWSLVFQVGRVKDHEQRIRALQVGSDVNDEVVMRCGAAYQKLVGSGAGREAAADTEVLV